MLELEYSISVRVWGSENKLYALSNEIKLISLALGFSPEKK